MDVFSFCVTDNSYFMMNDEMKMIPMNNVKVPKRTVKAGFFPYCFQKATSHCTKRYMILYQSL